MRGIFIPCHRLIPNMAPDSGLEDDPPLIEPWLFKMLKDRPRLIDKGYREQACDSMCRAIRERRKPDQVAGRLASSVANNAQKTGAKVTKEVAEGPIRQAAQNRF